MTRTLHLRLAAAGLVAGPVAFTIGDTLRRVVDHDTNGAVQLTGEVADHSGVWLAAALLSVLAAALFLPGVAALAATATGRGSTVTAVGAYLMGLGLIASVGHAVAFYTPFALYGRAHTTASAIESLDHESEGYPVLVALIVLFIVGMMLGTLVLLVGLRRAGRIPVWSVVAGLVFVVLGSTAGVWPGVLELVAALLAFVPAAHALLRVAPATTPATTTVTGAGKAPAGLGAPD
jgi:hypothetical protein